MNNLLVICLTYMLKQREDNQIRKLYVFFINYRRSLKHKARNSEFILCDYCGKEEHKM
jgi:hypothetical protein